MIRIAIIEDNTAFREALGQVVLQLKDALLVGSFASPHAALEKLPTLNPDIVLVDINLPELNGIDLIRSLRLFLDGTQYLVCTVHDDSNTVFESLRAGAAGYLLKDATAAEIQDAILEVQQGGSPMSPYIARQVIGYFQQRPFQVQKSDYELSTREKQVLELMSRGLQYKEIALNLEISIETVKKHLRNIYQKMQVSNRIEAINKYRTQ